MGITTNSETRIEMFMPASSKPLSTPSNLPLTRIDFRLVVL